MGKTGRPSNPQPLTLTVVGDAPSVSSVNPRASVLASGGERGWTTNGRGWLNFENWGWVSSDEKQEMLLDAQVSALLHLRRSWVLQDGVQITPTEGVSPMKAYRQINEKYERAVKAADLCRWMLCNTSDSFHDTLMQWQHADWWRNQASDLIWREQEWGEYAGKLMLDRMPVYGPDSYLIWRKNGRIIGLESLNEPRENGRPKVYPIEKFALHRFRPDARHPLGSDLARVAQMAHFIKRESQPERLKNLAQFGSPYTYATAPENAVHPVPLLDADENEMTYPAGHPKAGQVIMVSPARAMQENLREGFESGGQGVFPGGASVNLLQAQGDGKIFSDIARDMNWELAVAILGTGTLTQEQNYGSNATAKTGSETVNTPILSDKTALADVIKKSICTMAVRYNLPKKYWDVVPTVTCGDPKANLWESLLTTLLNTMPAEQAIEIGGELARRNGLPDLDFARLREMAQNGELPVNTIPQSNGQSDNGSTQTQ